MTSTPPKSTSGPDDAETPPEPVKLESEFQYDK